MMGRESEAFKREKRPLESRETWRAGKREGGRE